MPHDFTREDRDNRDISMDRHLGRIEERIKGCENALNKVEGTLEQLRDRVPPWIVWAMTIMAAAIGSLLTLTLR